MNICKQPMWNGIISFDLPRVSSKVGNSSGFLSTAQNIWLMTSLTHSCTLESSISPTIGHTFHFLVPHMCLQARDACWRWSFVSCRQTAEVATWCVPRPDNNATDPPYKCARCWAGVTLDGRGGGGEETCTAWFCRVVGCTYFHGIYSQDTNAKATCVCVIYMDDWVTVFERDFSFPDAAHVDACSFTCFFSRMWVRQEN